MKAEVEQLSKSIRKDISRGEGQEAARGAHSSQDTSCYFAIRFQSSLGYCRFY